MSTAVSQDRDDPQDNRQTLGEPATGPVVVRRSAGVSALIGAAASGIAIAYLWRATGSGAPLDWALCLVMAGIGAVYLANLVDARTPLLVADHLGVRIRFGNQWRGLPWDAVGEVVVEPPDGRLRDGRLAFTPHSVARALEGLDSRGRRSAALNQKMYGAALAVPIGLTTRVSARGTALADALTALAGGRADVVVPAHPSVPDPGETVVPAAAEESRSDPVPESNPDDEPTVPIGVVTAAVPVVRAAPTIPAGVPLREIRHAVRAQVTRDAPATVLGNAALLPDGGDAPRRTLLPERDELRRPQGSELVEPGGRRTDDGRVRPISTLGDPVEALVVDDFVTEPAYDPVIGPELAAARTRVGLSVDELSERTRIRPHVIESIEVDDFAPCGGDFYARGHLRTLARVLGRDPVPLLEQFDRRYATAPVDARRVFEAELATGMTGSMRRTVGGPNWVLLVGVVLALVLTWGAVRLFASEPPQQLRPGPVLNGSAGLTGVHGPRLAAAPVAASPPVRLTLVGARAGLRVVVRDRSH